MRYKILLVDDEKFVISHLRSCIDWESMDIEVVDDAYDGEEALAKTRLHRPDIVITDIVMPNMTGLDYIERIQQTHPCQIIILSGHRNFDFAKRAIAYGVVDYIVKPSLIGDILAALQKAIAAIVAGHDSPAKRLAGELAGYPRAVRDAIAYINDHYQEPFTMEDLSNVCYFSPNYLGVLFKKHTGQGIPEYVRNLRIDEAKRLLQNGQAKAYEVALQVGYSDYELFRRVFKKMVGVNPNLYKNSC